jgi:hypothetical protein
MIVGSSPYLSSSIVACAAAIAIGTKCNAQTLSTPLSCVFPTYNILNSFLFLTFPFTSLHSSALNDRFLRKFDGWVSQGLDLVEVRQET